MTSMRRIYLLLTLGAIAIWAQDAPAQRPRLSAEAVQRGRAQFAQSCAFCHGPNATGGTHGPSLICSAVVRHDENGSLLAGGVWGGPPPKGEAPHPTRSQSGGGIVAVLSSPPAGG